MKIEKLSLAAGGQAIINATPPNTMLVIGSVRDSFGNVSNNVRVASVGTSVVYKVSLQGFPLEDGVMTTLTFLTDAGQSLFVASVINKDSKRLLKYGGEDHYFQYDNAPTLLHPKSEVPHAFANLNSIKQRSSVLYKALSKYRPKLSVGSILNNEYNNSNVTSTPILGIAEVYDNSAAYNAYTAVSITGQRNIPPINGGRSLLSFTHDPANWPGASINTQNWIVTGDNLSFNKLALTGGGLFAASTLQTPLNTYLADIQLSSTSALDEDLCIVLATSFDVLDRAQLAVNGKEGGVAIHTLTLVRSMGADGNLFSVIVDYGLGPEHEIVVADVKTGVKWGNGGTGATAAASGHAASPMASKSWGFNSVGVRLLIEKTYTVSGGVGVVGFTIRTSQANSTSIDSSSPVISFSILEDDPILGMFYQPSHFGVGTRKQTNAKIDLNTFINGDRVALLVEAGAIDSGKLAGITTLKKIKQTSANYNTPTYAWVSVPLTVNDVQPNRLWFSQDTKDLWTSTSVNGGTKMKLISKGK